MIRDFTAEGSAHETGVGLQTHPAQIKPVGIPAGPDRRVGMMQSVGVPDTGIVQQSKLFIGEIKP